LQKSRTSKACRAKWLAKNRDQERARQRAFYHDTVKPDAAKLERKRASYRKWYRKNAAEAKRRRHLRERLIVPRQTPSWANRFFIGEIYDLARLRTKHLGIPHEVDHIVPLRGKAVCGLHVETNLRVVPKAINRAKGNTLQAH